MDSNSDEDEVPQLPRIRRSPRRKRRIDPDPFDSSEEDNDDNNEVSTVSVETPDKIVGDRVDEGPQSPYRSPRKKLRRSPRRKPHNTDPDPFYSPEEDNNCKNEVSTVSVVTPDQVIIGEEDDDELFPSNENEDKTDGNRVLFDNNDDEDLFPEDNEEQDGFRIPPKFSSQCHEAFMLRELFPGKVRIYEETTFADPLPQVKVLHGNEYHLVATKFEKSKSNNFTNIKSPPKYIKAYYVKCDANDLWAKLQALANFQDLALDLPKLAARMELLVSPAAHCPAGAKQPYLFHLKASQFEVLKIPQNQSMGCGFIPREMLKELVGHGAKGANAAAVQVRILGHRLGLFKGLLVAKAGITKIQLTESMRKVPRSAIRGKKTVQNDVLMLFNDVMPSVQNENFERVLNPNYTRKPRKMELKPISDEMGQVLIQCGVQDSTLSAYYEESRYWNTRKHTWLRGVCDCTASLPEGTCFIPGLFPLGKSKKHRVLVTRSPCVHATDFATLPVVTSKPRGMSKEDWEHLSSLPFGLLMFASPADKYAPSLPDLINASDLDGDIFLTIWHDDILHEVGNLRPGRAITQGPITLSKFKLDENVLYSSKNGEQEEALIGLLYADGIHYDIFCRGKLISNVHETRLKSLPQAKSSHINVKIIAIKGTQVSLLCGDEEQTSTVTKLRASDPYLLAQYIFENNLIKQKRWKWCEKYVTPKKIVKVHRIDVANAMATVLWDGDEETETLPITDVDEALLHQKLKGTKTSIIKRARSKTAKDRWNTYFEELVKLKETWFESLQDHLSNIERLHLHDTLRTRLHGLYMNKDEKFCRSDVLVFGKAFKLSNDIAKHSGRVPLPSHLRDYVVQNMEALGLLIADDDATDE
ncbi:hypothetical protein CTEN210_18479 [Chaetoceros tenuissimus]|uniref:RNA-dependent RNA polymerase n=1 Tax=Chaetoceros tenuissimus TaxID=426638 RepID=A0AAD3DCS2_9STRA|nr:hypothetical protein CTEN210_18479 [Chaetoceros tenuissimus]